MSSIRRGGGAFATLRRAELLLLGVLVVHCGGGTQYDDDDDSNGGNKSGQGGSSARSDGGASGVADVLCTPGATQACTNASGCRGARTCSADGSGFGACTCESDAGGAAGQADGFAGAQAGDAGATNDGGTTGGSGGSKSGSGGSKSGSGGTTGGASARGGSGGSSNAGSGNTTSSGGSAGSSTDPFADCTLAPVAPAPTVALLDDFEDGDLVAQGYGSWFSFDDGTAEAGDEAALATSTTTRASGDAYTLEFTTGIHTGYGSGFGVILHDDAGTQELEDVSTAYDGVEFWARAAAPGAFRMNFPDVNSDPQGGVCSQDDGTCFQYWGTDLDLDTTWRLYRVQWDELYTESGTGEPFDPHSLYRIEFAVAPGTSLDVSIDDVNFFHYGSSAYYVSGRQFRKQHAEHLFHGLDRPSMEWDPRGDHLSRADLELMAGWGADTVRIPLNQDFWLSDSPSYDAGYADLVDKMVACAHTADLDVILDLHWSDTGDYGVTPGQQQMADAHSATFWQELAARYKNNSRVLFELYNEPHDVTWPVWRDGGAATGFTAVGFQQLYDAVRGTGAENVVLAGGLSYAFDLSGLPAYKLRGYNIGYVTHPYNFPGKQPADWPYSFGTAATIFPVIATEFGDTTSCSSAYNQSFIEYAASLDISWTAWAWYVASSNPCAFPTLISDWDGTPTTAGSVVEAALTP